MVGTKILAAEQINWAGPGGTGVPIALVAETGHGGDDISISLAGGETVEVQAKERVQVGVKFWVAMLDLAGAVNASPNVYGVLLTGSRASSTIRSDLKRDLPRVGQGRMDDLKGITEEFIGRLRKANIVDITGCCTRIQIVVADFEPGSQGEELIRGTLRGIIFDRTKAPSAHDALSKDALRLTVERGRRDEDSLKQTLGLRGIVVTSPAAAAAAVALQPIHNQLSHIGLTLTQLSMDGVEAQEKLRIVEVRMLTDALKSAWTNQRLEIVSAKAQELSLYLATNAHLLPGFYLADAYAVLVELESNRISDGSPVEERLAAIEAMINAAEHAIYGLQSDDATTVRQRLHSLKAFVAAISHGAETGLALLAGRTDRYSIRRRLAILIRDRQYDSALSVVEGSEIDAQWADKAAHIYSESGRSIQAAHVIQWAKSISDRPELPLVCANAAATGACAATFTPGPDELRSVHDDLSDAQHAKLLQARSYLTDFTDGIMAFGSIRSSIEMQAMYWFAMICVYLHDYVSLALAIDTLETWHPIPLILTELVQYSVVPCASQWPDRLRLEYPDNIEIEVLAAIIAPDDPDQNEQTFERLRELASRPDVISLPANERRAICVRMAKLASAVGDEARAILRTIERELLSDDESSLQTMQLLRAINSARYEDAAAILSQDPDREDIVWLQSRAVIAVHDGKPVEALKNLRQAVSSNNEPGLLLFAANMAVQADDPVFAIDLLTRYVERRQNDEAARHQLAFSLLQQGEFMRAREHFEMLWNADREDVRRANNYATALVQTGDAEASIAVYEAACAGDPPFLHAVMARSAVLKSLGRTREAFEKLIGFRPFFWEEPTYLMAVSDLGYAAQEEELAMEALAYVRQLQAIGKADADLVRMFTLDEAVQMFADNRDRSQDAQSYVVRGQLPWLMVDRLLNQTAFEALINRTRSLEWIGEFAYAHATTAIYSTNSFYIDRGAHRERAFRSLPAPLKGAPVVADITSLMTLHRLNLLDLAAQFFGQIFIPSIYFPFAVEEGGKLVPHQPSRLAELEIVNDTVEAGRISVAAELQDVEARVAEYEDAGVAGESGIRIYGLSDIVPTLQMRGLISAQLATDSERFYRRVVVDQLPIAAYSRVAIDPPTLKLLASSNLLAPTLDGFRVVISEREKASIAAELSSSSV